MVGFLKIANFMLYIIWNILFFFHLMVKNVYKDFLYLPGENENIKIIMDRAVCYGSYVLSEKRLCVCVWALHFINWR